MNVAMHLFRTLSGVGIVPTAVLISGEDTPRHVASILKVPHASYM